MQIQDVKLRSQKFRIADKRVFTELYLKSKSEHPIQICSNRVNALVCEKYLYDVFFYTEMGLPFRTSLIESFIDDGKTIVVYPNMQFLKLYGVIVEEAIAEQEKLLELELEEQALSDTGGL